MSGECELYPTHAACEFLTLRLLSYANSVKSHIAMAKVKAKAKSSTTQKYTSNRSIRILDETKHVKEVLLVWILLGDDT